MVLSLNMAHCRPVQLPLDLIGIIAADVASDRDDKHRTQTLMDCMLVRRAFACEFRPHLFEIFKISDISPRPIEYLSKRLTMHAQTLEDHPEYRKFVKILDIELGIGMGPSLLYDPHFPLWLKGLTSVTTFSLASCAETLEFALLEPPIRDAMVRLYSLPSIRRMTFFQVENLPPRLFRNVPNLEYLRLSDTFVEDPSQEDFNELGDGGVETPTAFTTPQIHLDIPCYTVDEEVPRTLQALAPIFPRLWKVSGVHNTISAAMLISMCALRAGDTLRDLDLTLSNICAEMDEDEIKIAPLIVFSAKSLERLTLTFRKPRFNLPSDEPNIRAQLYNISNTVSRIRHSEGGSLRRLSTIAIVMHDLPAQCLCQEGIANGHEGWEALDHALAKEGYLPGLERLELKLLLRKGESMSEEETKSSVSCLLPSLAPTVRVITISSAEMS
ncbi:hypothetical protein BKA70DRAFT_1406359 [Coprinopsis sp. MPI-PUGE-AT-0042]|nr:hypothetical protein BKA70DRAFT_1406359 [Coprinopsis sp. MPI-PUGE-AT-0042]